MKLIDDRMICELNILKNRLDSGESIIQCLGTMGIPLSGNIEFLEKWKKLSYLMMEGRILPAKAVSQFVEMLENRNRLIQLVNQKTLSPRIQAYLSIGIIFVLIFSSQFLFPDTLKPSFTVLSISLSLSLISTFFMHKLLKRFLNQLYFLEWISFLRSLSLSLQCGMTLPAALLENTPPQETLKLWPKNLTNKISLDYLEKYDDFHREKSNSESKLWEIAVRVWKNLCKNYRDGHPQVELISKLSQLQENEFKNWILTSSDKLSYLLLLPLFLLSVPAVLILLFAPLLSALV